MYFDDRRRGSGPQSQPLVHLCACGSEVRHARIVSPGPGKKESQPFFTLEEGFGVADDGCKASVLGPADRLRARAEIEQLKLPSSGPPGQCLRQAK